LPSNLKSLIKYLSKSTSTLEPAKIETIKNDNFILKQNTIDTIINCFNNKKSILLAFPTESDLNFYLDHFKTIFDESNFAIFNKKISTKNLNT
jgi:hypothetical protein